MRRFLTLRRKADFMALRRHGRRVSTSILTLYRGDAPSGDPTSLVGISVSKTIGKAVVRNKLRRRISAIIHEALEERPPMRLLVVPRSAAASAAFATLRADLASVLSR
jgi:ribonuclease P protein component